MSRVVRDYVDDMEAKASQRSTVRPTSLLQVSRVPILCEWYASICGGWHLIGEVAVNAQVRHHRYSRRSVCRHDELS